MVYANNCGLCLASMERCFEIELHYHSINLLDFAYIPNICQFLCLYVCSFSSRRSYNGENQNMKKTIFTDVHICHRNWWNDTAANAGLIILTIYRSNFSNAILHLGKRILIAMWCHQAKENQLISISIVYVHVYACVFKLVRLRVYA